LHQTRAVQIFHLLLLLQLSACEAQRLRALELENSKLKRLLADAHLDIAALKDVVGRKW
jgi:putative transposase